MNKGRRIQLTLFVDEKQSAAIERIRQKFNPLQYRLIRAHVTLCREDEIESIEKVLHNLLPANDILHSFRTLRSQVLYGIIEAPRNHEPHITLMHPRNSICTDDIFQQIIKINLPTIITFGKVSLIEQVEIEPWKIIQEFDLNEPA